MEKIYTKASNFFHAMLILASEQQCNITVGSDLSHPAIVVFTLHCNPSCHVRFLFKDHPTYEMENSIEAMLEVVKANPEYTESCMQGTVDGVYLPREELLESFIEKMGEFKNKAGTQLNKIYESIVESLVTSNVERIISPIK